ncbi:MAG: extracellular solute-binding protein [Caldilineaceae bacterium]|nr:extracellular solute-binding protein [Caldilineaceae bacterium]
MNGQIYPLLRRIAGMLLMALILTGCADLPQIDLSAARLPWWGSDQNAPAAMESLSVLVWDEGAQTEILRELIDAFELAEPGLPVELIVSNAYDNDLQARISGGDLPDLLLVDSFRFPDLAAEGMLAAGQNRLDSSDDFYPILIAAFQQDGVAYCRPREVRTLALIYDAVGFAKAGLQPPATWDAMRQAAETLTDVNTGSFGLIVSPDLSRWLPFLYGAGGQLINEEGRMVLESAAAANAIDYYIAIFRQNFAGQPAESNSSWAGEVLGKGKGSMAFEGNWVIPYFAAEFPQFEYGVAPLPSGPGGRATVAFSSCYAVTADSTHQDRAFALARFLTRGDSMKQWTETAAFMPSRISLADGWLDQFPVLSPFMDGLNEARVWQFPPGFAPFLRTFNRNMIELYAANIEAADLLGEMQRVGAILLNRQTDRE